MGPNYALTTLFVVPESNTLPANTKKTYDLSATTGQFGIFKGTAHTSAAATGDVASTTPYLFLAQGRKENTNNDGIKLATKKTDKIYPSKIKQWYKVPASTSNLNQITKLSGFDMIKPDEQVSLSVRARSRYIDNAFAQSIGLLKTLTYNTKCSDCGDDPCTELTAAELETMVDWFVTEGNANFHLSKYFTFNKEIAITVADASTFQVGEAVTSSTGSGTGTVVSADTTTDVVVINTASASSTFTGNLTPAAGAASAISAVNNTTALKLVITAKDPYAYGSGSAWTFTNNSYEVDKITFETYFYKGAPTTVDAAIPDRCEDIVTITKTQLPTFPEGTAAAIKQLEKRCWSYQSGKPELFDDPDWNGGFTSYVTAANYDSYYIEFESTTANQWNMPGTQMTEWAHIAVPTGEASTIEAILEVVFGTCKDVTA